MSLNKAFLKNEVKSVAKNKSDFGYDRGMMNLKKCRYIQSSIG